MKKPKVFIVDDQPKNILLLQDILKEITCEVYAARDGGKALELIKKNLPDLVLLDIRMPGIDGFEVCRTLKADRTTAAIPVIFLSALDSIEDKNRAFELGAVDYIAKPFNVLEATARIRTHLKNSLSFYRQNMLLKKIFHELYTPLSVITTGAELIRLKHDDSKELVNIMAATRTLHHLYDDLYYGIKEKRGSQANENVDLKAFVERRINYFSIIAKAKYITFSLDDNGENSSIDIPPSELERLVDNTISNAIKYSHKEKSIAIGISEEGGDTLFSVTNEGESVSDTQTLFSPFFQENTQSDGVGLGLTIVKEVCDKNGINVQIDSNEGVTTFRYRFKRRNDENSSAGR